MPNVTKEDYADPYQILEAMRYKTLDRWSYILSYEEYLNQITGTFVGHGFRIGLDDSGNARIAMVYSNSSLYSSGVRRGWIVKTINNTAIAPILLSSDWEAYSTLIGASEAGITNTFVFTKPDGNDVTISATKSAFQINTVLLSDTLHLSNGITGHLVFDQFFAPAPEELIEAFTFYKTSGIKDLILDLRYNPGGYFSIMQSLVSYIAGNTVQGKLLLAFQYNDKHQDANVSFPFLSTSYDVSLPRLVVITSRSTISASETLINSLKPYIDVVTIGDTTNGKPTGMNEWNLFNKYYVYPVTVKVVNSQGYGDFFDGIAPDQVVSDDISRDFGDKNELCLKEAIYYLENNTFSGKSGAEFKRYPQFSENQGRQVNGLIFER